MHERPPRLEGRQAFGLWLCQAHNDVNAQLGKPPFPCDQVDRRWRHDAVARRHPADEAAPQEKQPPQ